MVSVTREEIDEILIRWTLVKSLLDGKQLDATHEEMALRTLVYSDLPKLLFEVEDKLDREELRWSAAGGEKIN